MPVSSYSDDELILAIRQDDEKAFEELFERYWKHVHAMAYARVLSMPVTKEIVQKVFISLWDQRATLSIFYLPLYLNALTINCVVKYMGPATHNCDYSEQVIGPHPHFTAQVNEFMKAGESCRNDVYEKPKKIVGASRLDELSVREFARSFISLKRLFNSLSHNHQKS